MDETLLGLVFLLRVVNCLATLVIAHVSPHCDFFVEFLRHVVDLLILSYLL